MTGRWMIVGMLTMGSGSMAWAQSGPQPNSISVTAVYPDNRADSRLTGQWQAASMASRRATRVSARPTATPSLAPESLVCSHGLPNAPAAPARYDVMRYVPVAQTQMTPAPVAVVPVSPTITDAPHRVFRPMIPLASPKPVYYFGQGLLGQPKLYVPGQPIRNVLRYLSL